MLNSNLIGIEESDILSILIDFFNAHKVIYVCIDKGCSFWRKCWKPLVDTSRSNKDMIFLPKQLLVIEATGAFTLSPFVLGVRVVQRHFRFNARYERGQCKLRPSAGLFEKNSYLRCWYSYRQAVFNIFFPRNCSCRSLAQIWRNFNFYTTLHMGSVFVICLQKLPNSPTINISCRLLLPAFSIYAIAVI